MMFIAAQEEVGVEYHKGCLQWWYPIFWKIRSLLLIKYLQHRDLYPVHNGKRDESMGITTHQNTALGKTSDRWRQNSCTQERNAIWK